MTSFKSVVSPSFIQLQHQDTEFVIKFSAMEIYNEVVRDLLSHDHTPLRLLDDPEVNNLFIWNYNSQVVFVRLSPFFFVRFDRGERSLKNLLKKLWRAGVICRNSSLSAMVRKIVLVLL